MLKNLWEIKYHYEIKGYELVKDYIDELKALIAGQVAELQSHRLDEHSALEMLEKHFQQYIYKNHGVIEAIHEIRSMSPDDAKGRENKMKSLVTQFFHSKEGENFLREAARDLLGTLTDRAETLIKNPA